jgi:hypothetical protein
LAVSQAAAPEARHSIEKLRAISVIDINMFSAINNSTRFLDITIKVGKGMQVIISIKFLPLLGCSAAAHNGPW